MLQCWSGCFIKCLSSPEILKNKWMAIWLALLHFVIIESNFWLSKKQSPSWYLLKVPCYRYFRQKLYRGTDTVKIGTFPSAGEISQSRSRSRKIGQISSRSRLELLLSRFRDLLFYVFGSFWRRKRTLEIILLGQLLKNEPQSFLEPWNSDDRVLLFSGLYRELSFLQKCSTEITSRSRLDLDLVSNFFASRSRILDLENFGRSRLH